MQSEAMRCYRPLAMGRRGGVVSNHPLATQAGFDMLKSGGNAFDAAVAVASSIAVVEPGSNGVGGDGFFLLHEAGSQRNVVVHAACPAARAASLDVYREGIPWTGALSAMPPGAAAGWLHIAAHYASRPVPELFRAAVYHAREGFPASRHLCDAIARSQSALAADPGCAELYLSAGKPPALGAPIKNPALARTLEALAFDGAAALYGGDVGRKLCEFLARAGGVIEIADLETHTASEHDPLSVQYRDLQVLESGPPTMGFALLLELGIAGAFDLASLEALGADAVHTLVEVKKLAFAEREEYAGDPAFVDQPWELMLGNDHLSELADRISPRHAASLAPRAAGGGSDTTYFAVVDGYGNAVSGIQSIAGPFGAALLDPESGILLNNRMVWFHTDPDHPNALLPRKHVRNTINTPLALRDGGVACVWGTPGGDAQVQVSLQTLSLLVDHGLDPQQALEAPRWMHHQPGTGSYYPHIEPDLLILESRFASGTVEELARRGHTVKVVGPLDGGAAASMIARDESGLLLCAADPRRDGWALAF